jgi:RNA polymerase sigma-70 factor (ECF subfamily)
MALDVGELFERYHGVVYRRCLVLLRNPEDAAEAVQEVFEHALKGLGRFHLRSSPLTWLYAIATRHCLQQVRNRSARGVKSVLLNVAVPHADAAGHLAVRLDLDRLAMSLDASDVELAVYAYRDELTQEEIADVLRLSRKTVGKRLKVLADRLARVLGQSGANPAVRPAPSGEAIT